MLSRIHAADEEDEEHTLEGLRCTGAEQNFEAVFGAFRADAEGAAEDVILCEEVGTNAANW